MFIWDFSKKVPEEADVNSPEVQGCDLSHCPVSSAGNTEFHDLMVTVTKVAPAFTSATRPSLLVNIRCISTAFLLGPSITCSRKLSSVLSNHLLDCLCLAVLFLQQMLEWLKSPMRTRDFDCTKEYAEAGDHEKDLCIIFWKDTSGAEWHLAG